jgi:hypothetical protein
MNEHQIIERLKSRVVRSAAYFDVVGAFLSRHLTKEELEELKRLCPNVYYGKALLPDGRLVRCSIQRKVFVMQATVVLRQPTREAIDYIDTLYWSEPPVYATIFTLELSLDWCTRTYDDAVVIGKLVESLSWKRGRKLGARVTPYRDGFTIGNSPRGKRLKVYWDRPSKVSGMPCAHIEWRLSSRRAVSEIGVRNMFDLLAFAHGGFWQRKSPLHWIDYEALGKKLAGRHLASAADVVGRGQIKFNRDVVRSKVFLKQQARRFRMDLDRLTINHQTRILRRTGISTTRILKPLRLPPDLLPFLLGLRRAKLPESEE